MLELVNQDAGIDAASDDLWEVAREFVAAQAAGAEDDGFTRSAGC